MEGLGSQLYNHLVERVIDHIEQSINPRLEEYYRITQEMLMSQNRFSMCYICETPFECELDTVVRCKKLHYGSLCDLMVTCGRSWCKPLTCQYCGDELCVLKKNACYIDGCKKSVCSKCIFECSVCNIHICQEHAKTYLKSAIILGCYKDNCVYEGKVCFKHFKDKTVYPCSVCNRKFSVFDLSVELTNIDCAHGFCGRAVCKNEERGSH